MNRELNIIKFLSIVFSAKLYPMRTDKIKQIAKSIFKDEKITEDIVKEFAWTGEKYYLNSLDILSVKNVIRAIKNTFLKWDDSKYIYSLCILYNSSDNKNLFYKNLKSIFTKKTKVILANYIKEEILKIETYKYVKDEYMNVKLNNLIDYEQLFNYFRPHAYNSCIIRLFAINRELNCISWNKIIELLPCSLLKFLCNFEYYFYKKPMAYYLKQIQRNNSDDLISLAILNTISILNRKNDTKFFKKGFSQIFDAINILPNKRKYYWYGIILSNMEYCIARKGETPIIFEKIGKRKLVKLLENKCSRSYLKYLEQGLRNSLRDCYYKYLIIFLQISKSNKTLAIELAKKIIKDYINKLKSNEGNNLSFSSHHEKDYCNTVIEALLYLFFENNLNIYKLLTKMFSQVNIDKEDFYYSYSKLLNNKNKTIHLYIVALFTLENIKIKTLHVNQKYVNKLIKNYFKFINNFLAYFNEQEWYSLTNIINLKIVKDNKYISKEIEYIYTDVNPNFEVLAYLLSIQHDLKQNIKIYSFINDFFLKYNKCWANSKYEKWLKIWIWLDASQNVKFCLSKLPKSKQSEYCKIYNINFTSCINKQGA